MAAEAGVQIECGTNKAILFIEKLKGGSDSPCVWFEDKWLTPIEFQDVSGRRAAKDWKRSIKYDGKPLRELLQEADLGGEVSLEAHESSQQASSFDGMDAEASGDAPPESDLVVADIPEGQKPLICVEFPAFVDNDERAIASLGGLENISNAVLHHKRNLEVRFRPEDSYCKPAVAKETKVANLVLRVKRRRKKGQRDLQSLTAEPQATYNFPPRSSGSNITEAANSPSTSGPDLSSLRAAMGSSSPVVVPAAEPGGEKAFSEGRPKYEYSAEVLGLVDTSYEFPGMADFQILPPGLNMANHGSLLVDPELFQITEPLDDSNVELNVPSFLPPQTFSKFDKPMTNYAFRSVDPKVKLEGKATSLTDCGRARRTSAAHSVAYNSTEPVPTRPHPDSPPSSHPKLKALNQLFEERPVWSRLALQSLLKLPQGVIRSLLSAASYNFTSGPWKKLWVKFGYDPRKDPSAKIYQCLDFRVPKEVDVESERSRRLASQAPPRLAPVGARGGVKAVNSRVFQLVGEQGASVRQAELRTSMREEGDPAVVTAADETAYIFTTDKLPSQRQLFYQLCDLKDDSLQAIIHSNDGRETTCTESNGWCEEHSYEKLRRALAEMTKKTADKVRAKQYQKLGTSTDTRLLKSSTAT